MRIKLPAPPGVTATLQVYPEHPSAFRFSLWTAHRSRGLKILRGDMHRTLADVFRDLAGRVAKGR